MATETITSFEAYIYNKHDINIATENEKRRR